jgi:uncharacterized protein YqjF (DUF2071 family)
MNRAQFLTAEWRHLSMVSFEIDPKVIRPLVPRGTELDAWQGRTFVSMVGFLFLDTRVLGLAIPYHRDFEEVNLRFYVRRKASDGWRRGVVFVKEIVPRAAIAFVAKALYGENYVSLPMRHCVDPGAADAGPRAVLYSWRFRGQDNRMELSVETRPAEVAPGSAEEFITEHYWGYARRRGDRTTEYRVEHPRWRVATGTATLDVDASALYGAQFAEFLKAHPASAFLADGSRVSVSKGAPLVI